MRDHGLYGIQNIGIKGGPEIKMFSGRTNVQSVHLLSNDLITCKVTCDIVTKLTQVTNMREFK